MQSPAQESCKSPAKVPLSLSNILSIGRPLELVPSPRKTRFKTKSCNFTQLNRASWDGHFKGDAKGLENFQFTHTQTLGEATVQVQPLSVACSAVSYIHFTLKSLSCVRCFAPLVSMLRIEL